VITDHAAEPVRNTVVTRKLARCAHCWDLIYESASGAWRHNRNGMKSCGGGDGRSTVLEGDLPE
jgi:hypothetical protein